ncbi:hypothetical protein MMC08_005952 [Hypocenomyce scalaris]|nr:hypothetical protein [Hypocenomyce scalaris]
MPLAILKNLLFPSRVTPQASLSPTLSETVYSQGTSLNCKSQPQPRRHMSSATAVDVEAQQCDVCRPREDEPTGKRRRFELRPRMISDSIIGLSDGLTVPFALTAGLSSLGDTRLVVLGGLAELIAGAISMGLGGFIGAKSEAASYVATVAETQKLIHTSPCQTSSLVRSVFKPYDLPAETASTILKQLHASPEELLDFLMRFHHQAPEPDTSRPFVSAGTIAMGYFVGGLVPLLPYFCVKRNEVLVALWWSIGVMVIALFAFGWVKTGVVSGWRGQAKVLACVKGGLQMVIVGGVAAGAAVGMVRAINHD